MDAPPENDVCSICHQNFRIPCQANCSHWFCGSCILQVWNHSTSALRPCKCPLCRREITLLVPIDTHRMDGGADILQRIESYNRLFGPRQSGLMQRMQDIPFLFKRLLRDIMDPQRSLPLVVRARMYLAAIIGAIYVISPVDIIPEALLGVIGLLDDLIVVFMCFLYVTALYRTVLVSRHGGS